MSIMRALYVYSLIIFSILSFSHQSVSQNYLIENPKIEPTLMFHASRLDRTDNLDVYAVFSEVNQEKLAQLSSMGTLRTQTGKIATLSLSRKSLEALAALPFIERIGGGNTYHLALDISVPEIGADIVWTRVKDGAGNPVNGTGVIIGIVDTGIDITHKDFFFQNGTSKILYIWDQTVSGRPPARFNYGSEWTRSDIERGLALTADTHGHGTHVAGIAASSGQASGRWMGVAPGASLIVVKSGRPACQGRTWSFSDTQLLDGITYIWEKSRSLGKKTVINLSLGSRIGGHDGTDPVEILLDQIVSDGISVTVAAGNSGDGDTHAAGRVGMGESTTVPWMMDDDATSVRIDLWHDSADKLDVTIATPRGTRVLGPTPVSGIQTESGLVFIGHTLGEKSGNWQIEISSSQPLAAKDWSLIISGTKVKQTGKWDAYIDSNSCRSERTRFTAFQEALGSLNIPATAHKVIAVGAYATSQRLPTSVGGVGTLAIFSSRGPTRDGRIKPDVTAPGADIISALSSQSTILRRFTSFSGDAEHVPLRGSSMAAPHVAGLIALVWQRNPSLSSEQILDRIRGGARTDRFTGPIDQIIGSYLWGWGKVDAPTSTQFYTVRVVFRGIESERKVSLSIDDFTTEASAGSIVRLLFADGSSHKIRVPEIIQISPEARYRVERAFYEVSDTSIITFTFLIQYHLTIKSNHIIPQGAGWYDNGTDIRLKAIQSDQPGPGVRFLFTHWVVDGIPIMVDHLIIRMDKPHIVESIYSKQYYLTITSDGAEPLGEGWYDEGANAVLIAPQVVEIVPGERLVFSHWKFDDSMSKQPQLIIQMTRSYKAHAAYIREFLLKVISPRGMVTGSGWYEAGSSASFSISPVREGFLVQNIFVGWRGDHSGTSPSTSILMDGPKTVEALWAEDYTPLYLASTVASLIIISTLLLIRKIKMPHYSPAH